MVPIQGKPFLELKILDMKKFGVKDFVLCVGYLGQVIEDYFRDGRRLGVRIRYSYDGRKMLGPIGALKKAQQLLHLSFLVTYGDNYLALDYGRMASRLSRRGKLGMMAVYHNRNRFGRSDAAVRGDYVVRYLKNGHGGDLEWINYGISALNRDALKFVGGGFSDEEGFYNELISRKQLLAYRVNKRFFEIGDAASLNEFERFWSSRQGLRIGGRSTDGSSAPKEIRSRAGYDRSNRGT
jgi:NDP-sugar pyrophosphorylase family protein